MAWMFYSEYCDLLCKMGGFVWIRWVMISYDVHVLHESAAAEFRSFQSHLFDSHAKNKGLLVTVQ